MTYICIALPKCRAGFPTVDGQLPGVGEVVLVLREEKNCSRTEWYEDSCVSLSDLFNSYSY